MSNSTPLCRVAITLVAEKTVVYMFTVYFWRTVDGHVSYIHNLQARLQMGVLRNFFPILLTSVDPVAHLLGGR